MNGPELIIERRGNVQWLIFNRPESRNALTWAMYDSLESACNAVEAEKSVKAVVLTGVDATAFVSGTDIQAFADFSSEQDIWDYETRVERVLSSLECIRVPTIAAIAGACTGAGAVLASCCDLRIAAPAVRFGVPVARTLGNCLTMRNYVRLATLLGNGRLKDLVMRARLISAQELLAAGVLSEVVESDGALAARAQAIAEDLATFAPLTLFATKESLRRIRDAMVPDDKDLMLMCYQSGDFKHAVESFTRHGRPQWSGH